MAERVKISKGTGNKGDNHRSRVRQTGSTKETGSRQHQGACNKGDKQQRSRVRQQPAPTAPIGRQQRKRQQQLAPTSRQQRRQAIAASTNEQAAEETAASTKEQAAGDTGTATE